MGTHEGPLRRLNGVVIDVATCDSFGKVSCRISNLFSDICRGMFKGLGSRSTRYLAGNAAGQERRLYDGYSRKRGSYRAFRVKNWVGKARRGRKRTTKEERGGSERVENHSDFNGYGTGCLGVGKERVS